MPLLLQLGVLVATIIVMASLLAIGNVIVMFLYAQADYRRKKRRQDAEFTVMARALRKQHQRLGSRQLR